MSRRRPPARFRVPRNLLLMTVAAVLTVANLVLAGLPFSLTQGLFTDSAPSGGSSFATHPCFPTGMYVADITVQSLVFFGHHERILVTVRRDSDSDCTGESADAAVAGASVTVRLWRANGTPSNRNDDTLVGTRTGTTGSSGVFTSTYFTWLPNDTYYARVSALTHAGYFWKSSLDLETEQSHQIPH